MKGRPRPISLKTDVIKSRNRSKGKSTSKDRGGVNAKAVKERSESTSRSRDDGVVGKKSAPGGAAEDDDEMTDGRTKNFGDGYSDPDSAGRKARKTGPPPYGMMPMPGYGAPGYPYPYPYGYAQPHPHQHQPYPPPRSRSRSSENGRRAQSLDGRPRADGQPRPGATAGNPYNYPPPPPPGYHPGAPGIHPPEGYPYPPYPPYGAGYPGQAPFGYPPAHYPGPGGHPHAALAHAQALQPPNITHAQSDSRSRSPAAESVEAPRDSPRASASPPHASTTLPNGVTGPNPSYYPHPNPNYHLHQPYAHSPLAGAPRGPTSANGREHTTDANGRVTLAPIVGLNGGGSPRSTSASTAIVDPSASSTSSDKVHLPPITSVSGSNNGSHVVRHTALFEARGGSGTPEGLSAKDATPGGSGRVRGASVSSNSAASLSGSSEGLRSPETVTRGLGTPSWAKSVAWSADDERRGRPEKRFDEEKGKGREFDEIDELAEDDGEDDGSRRMVGVETGLGELRVVDQFYAGGPKPDVGGSSRSRSSGKERGRSRGGHPAGGRSQSTSRARGLASSERASSTSSGRNLSSEAEITRLKTKVAELTFLNGLMQSRLGQLEGPGRVPSNTMTSMTAETPRPDPDDDMYYQEETAEDEELEKYGVSAKDPTMRASLLAFFRAQGGGILPTTSSA